MKILFGNRKLTWKGGDSMKVGKFAEALISFGHEVIIADPDTVLTDDIDIVHSYNLNYSWSYYFYSWAKQNNKPFVLSTINFSIDSDLNKEKQKEMILGSDMLLMYSIKEKKSIQNYLNIGIWGNNLLYFINGVSNVFKDTTEWKNRQFEVISVVNEYHPRKNLVLLAKVLKEMRIKGYIFGSAGRYDGSSGFHVNELENVKEAGEDYIECRNKFLSHEELAEVYNNAKVVCQPSLNDPFPNPVYEGINSGCNVIVSKNTFVNLRNEGLAYCEPDNIHNIELWIKIAVQEQWNRVCLPSWEEQSKKLISLYRSLVRKKKWVN